MPVLITGMRLVFLKEYLAMVCYLRSEKLLFTAPQPFVDLE
jgi:hypothetical protein